MVTRLQFRCLTAAGTLLLLLGLAVAVGYAAEPEYVPDQVLVKFLPGTPASEIARAHAAAGSAVRDEIAQIGVQIVGLPRGLTVGRALGLYEHNPNVEFVEPDYYLEPALTPNDPWYLNWQRNLQLMGASEAWDITTGSPSVLIAVLDTGVDFAHPDFQGRLVAGWDFVQGDADPSDENGHGTSVTGVLGATTNNGFGVAGTSWSNPVLCVRTGDAVGSTTSSKIAQGITYAADQGACAINLSCGTLAYSAAQESAVGYAWGQGTVCIAAVGNSGEEIPYYPAALPDVIAVSGVEDHDWLVYYSNYGPWVDVCAPCNARTTMLGGSIGLIGGTSMSAPYVTGLFGLVFSANPSLTPQQAVDIVCGTATDLGDPGFDIYYGWGKINLYQAVLAASEGAGGGDTTPPTTSVTYPAQGAALSGAVAVTATASDAVGVTRVELLVDGALAGWVSTPPYSWTWITTGCADGAHALSVKAYDAAGNVGSSQVITVTVDNTPPSVAVTDPAAGATLAGTAPVAAAASDTATSVREVRFYLDGVWQTTAPTAPYVWQWDTTKSSQGWHSLAAKAFDAAGNEDTSTTVSVEVINSSEPAPITETFVSRVGYTRQSSTQTHSIAVNGSGPITASLAWSGRADLDLYLYSPSGALVATAANAGKGGSEHLEYQASQTGLYTCQVVAASGKASYTLVVTHP